MTIGFGMATANKWPKSTRILLLCNNPIQNSVKSVINSYVHYKLVPSVCNIHMMTLLVSQIFRNLSYGMHVSAVVYICNIRYVNSIA